jgi:hypothetical protein
VGTASVGDAPGAVGSVGSAPASAAVGDSGASTASTASVDGGGAAGTTGNASYEGVSLRRWASNWYPGLSASPPSSMAFRGIPAVVASTPGGGGRGYAPVPNTAIMGGAPQLPSAQSYPVRDPLLFGQPLPPVQR